MNCYYWVRYRKHYYYGGIDMSGYCLAVYNKVLKMLMAIYSIKTIIGIAIIRVIY